MKKLIKELKSRIESYAAINASIKKQFNLAELYLSVKGDDIQSLIDFYEQHHWRKVEDGLPEPSLEDKYVILTKSGSLRLGGYTNDGWCDEYGVEIYRVLYYLPINLTRVF